jgi:hypothetical protein
MVRHGLPAYWFELANRKWCLIGFCHALIGVGKDLPIKLAVGLTSTPLSSPSSMLPKERSRALDRNQSMHLGAKFQVSNDPQLEEKVAPEW